MNTTLFRPITKFEELEDGSLLVYGKMTGPDLDLDDQRCDPAWLATAVPGWAGNVREMHGPIAIGRAVDVERDGDDWYCTAKIVDPAAVKKVEEGVLTGFSIGIKSPKLKRDATAPNGLIVGGKIVETSLVDAPCNESCKLVLAKAVQTTVQPEGTTSRRAQIEVEELRPVPEPKLVEKRDFSTDERSHLAGSGAALPDGSFPIQNREDLENAIKAVGRAKDPDAAKKHIIARAQALRAEDLLPTDWLADHGKKAAQPGDTGPDLLAQARLLLRQLAREEAEELAIGTGGTGPVRMLCQLLDELDFYELIDNADDLEEAREKLATKLAGSRGLTTKAVAPDALPQLAEALGVTQIDQAVAELAQRLEKLESAPAGTGPTRLVRRTSQHSDTDEEDRLDKMRRLDHLRQTAPHLSDLAHRKGVESLIRQIEAELREGR